MRMEHDRLVRKDRNGSLSVRGSVRGLSLRIAVVLSLLLAASQMMTRTSVADDDDDVFGGAGAANFVYVESNDPAGNAIFGFARHNDGSLTPLPRSPYAAGGLGITPTFALGPFDSDQNVIASPDRTLLFAVNGGSNTIAVFNIGANGVLTPVAGSPFPSGGSNPVSVGLAGNTLCVVNQDQDPGHPGQFLPNYTSFRVTPGGALIPIPNSTFYVDTGSSPSQALIAPNHQLLFGADFLGGLLRTFQIAPNGRLIPAVAQPLPPGVFAGTGAPPDPLGLAVHPELPLLYVDFVTINRIGVYRYSQAGNLQFLRSVADSGMGPCWARVNQEGTRMYASNTADSSVSVFDIGADPTTPVEIQKVTLRTTGNCFQFALDSTGSFLHVVTQQAAATENVTANGLNVLKVGRDGTLTEVPSSPTLLPVPNLVRPQGVAAL